MTAVFKRQPVARLRPYCAGGRLQSLLAMLILTLAATGSIAGDRGLPGLGSAGVRVLEITLPSGDAADVYLPRIAPGARDRFVDALPIVAVLQGALVDKSQYSTAATMIARQGFVVVVPNHFRSVPPLPFPVLFAEVDTVNEIFDAMVLADGDPASLLYQVVDTERMGLIGHSLGGAVGLYAIAGLCVQGICSADPLTYAPPAALQAAALYGTNLAEPDGTVTDLDTSGVAVALVQGSLDGIAAQEEAEWTYLTLETPSALIEIDGANHYGVCDVNNPPGAAMDPFDPTLPQSLANLAVGRWMALWLRAELLDDPWARVWIDRIGGSFDGTVNVVTD